MTNEQREAIDRLRRGLDDIWFATLYSQEEMDKDIDTAVSLIKEKDKIINEQLKDNVKLQKELNEENKRCMILANNDKFKEQMIGLMAEWISERCFYKDDYSNSCEIIQDSCSKKDDCKHCIEQYFERKATNNG